MKLIENSEQLEDWDEYREFMKLQLKQLAGTGERVFVTKDKVSFSINGKPWRAHAVLVGPRGLQSMLKLKNQGVLFREGSCSCSGKELEFGEVPDKLVKEAARTLSKLKLGFKIRGVDDADDADDQPEGASSAASASASSSQMEEEEQAMGATTRPDDGADLAAHAKKIGQAVAIWKKTEEAAGNELRKLQKALLALDDPRVKPIVQGLETIRTRIEGIDDEAKAVALAAQSKDSKTFESARASFRSKMQRIRAQVDGDELIRQADSNPLTSVKIGDTFRKSLDQLLKTV